jgi:hypothetical protein
LSEQEVDLVFSRATGLIAGMRDKIIDMQTDDGFDKIFHKAKEFSCECSLSEDLLQNSQNSDSLCKRPKHAQEVASCLPDFVTILILGNNVAEVKESTKVAFRKYYFLVIDKLCCEFESHFMNALPFL